MTAAFGMVRLGKDWKRFSLLLAVCGMLGGLLGWGINVTADYLGTHLSSTILRVCTKSPATRR